MPRNISGAILLIILFCATSRTLGVEAVHNIVDYGAVPNASGFDLDACKANGLALYLAAQAATQEYGATNSNTNSGDNNNTIDVGFGGDRTVLIPGEGYAPWAYMPHHEAMVGLYNVTFVLDGALNFWEGNISEWPMDLNNGNIRHGFEIDKSSMITLTSRSKKGGAIYGNGNRWWWAAILGPTHRPNMISLSNMVDTVLERWHLYNSPHYHVWLNGKNGVIQDTQVQVDIDGQRQLLEKAGHWAPSPPAALLGRQNNNISNNNSISKNDHGGAGARGGGGGGGGGGSAGAGEGGFPTFPLNTDGFDISGVNITVRRCHVENFDDALCAKSTPLGGNFSNCTTDLLFEDVTITNSVGASVGSTPPTAPGGHPINNSTPTTNGNCIANVTFRRISFKHPIKAIYVKPNPCAFVGQYGIIDNILYEDIYADGPLLWSIYVGTQQEIGTGDGGHSSGCSFFFPLPGQKCPTQNCTAVTKLKLRNVFMENALLSPGLLRCSAEAPCTGWNWSNVTIKSVQQNKQHREWPVGSDNFLCHGLVGANFSNVNAGCVNQTSQGVH